MRASIGRAGLIGHIDGTIAANPTDATWSSNDYSVLNHLHSGISEDVADMVLARDQTARQLWLALLELFSANKASKAIYLDNDFRQLVQGSSSIAEYCRRQKQLFDALADCDSPITNRALVLNTLRGLGPRFAAAATVISMTDPLPTFIRARSMLLMEEMQQGNAAANAASTALVVHAPAPAPCSGTACRGESPKLSCRSTTRSNIFTEERLHSFRRSCFAKEKHKAAWSIGSTTTRDFQGLLMLIAADRSLSFACHLCVLAKGQR
jgi:hypothetical protein